MTNINAIAQSSIAVVASIGAEIIALQEQAKLRRQEALTPFLEALAASGEVSIIVIRGSTPGFNDGEPCEHSADFFVNIEQIVGDDLHESADEYGFELPEELVDGIRSAREWNSSTRSLEEIPGAVQFNIDLCAEHGHVYKRPSDDVMAAIQALIFQTVEEDNGTDYYVTYLLKDGKFEVIKGDYDCGY